MKLTTHNCYFITLPTVNSRAKGTLCYGEIYKHIPFPIARMFYIFRVSPESIRGNHANKTSDQVLFCLHGAVTVHLDDGLYKDDIVLSKPNKGVHIGHMVWNTMTHFTKDTILFVVASDTYKKQDYIRSYSDFLRTRISK